MNATPYETLQDSVGKSTRTQLLPDMQIYYNFPINVMLSLHLYSVTGKNFDSIAIKPSISAFLQIIVNSDWLPFSPSSSY